MTELVDPYGLYGWKGSFSIRIGSENCISLRGIRILFKLYQSQGVRGGGGGWGAQLVKLHKVFTEGK